jgi:putative Holliday junction resolvase
VRLGIDVGRVRIGVAICDPDGVLATPLGTLRRAAPADVAAVAQLVAQHDAVAVVVGLPINLAGVEGPAAAEVREYAALLSRTIAPIPVIFSDERMSTAAAARRLSERGVRGGRRRAVVDQAAAVEILQGWLDAQRQRD